MALFAKKTTIPAQDEALRGATRRCRFPASTSSMAATSNNPPVPDSKRPSSAWVVSGEQRKFWELPGVVSTAVGYAGGHTPNANYEEVCTGRTGHTEVVRVIYDPNKISYEALLKAFWESHDPTQGMRQGNDVGTQYRSAIYTTTERRAGPRKPASARTSRR